MTYIEDINIINQVKARIASDIISNEQIEWFGKTDALYKQTYNIHEVGKKPDSTGKKRYRDYDCYIPGTNNFFSRQEARKFVSMLIKRYAFVEREEDLKGKSGWYSQIEDGNKKAFIFFKKSFEEKNKSLYIKFNAQFFENHPIVGRGLFMINMLSFHPSYGLTNHQIEKINE